MTKDEIRAIRERAGKAKNRKYQSSTEDNILASHYIADVPALCDAVEEARGALRTISSYWIKDLTDMGLEPADEACELIRRALGEEQ